MSNQNIIKSWLPFIFAQFYNSSFICVQESKAILTQAKHTRTASAHLTSHIDSALQQLAEQEMLTDTANSQLSSEVPNTDIYMHIWTAESMHIDPCFLCGALKTVSIVCLLHLQPEVSLTHVKEDMEAAKLQLKAYSDTLTELISKIGKSLSYRLFFTVAPF